MSDAAAGQSLFEEGRNCWRKGRAGRVAFLVDGEAYFGAVHDAIARAERTVYIAGWDIDSRVALRRRNDEELERTRLAVFIERMISEKPELKVYILVWDFAMVFALEREILPIFRFDWRSDGRLNFQLDGEHPLGASHHQKIVVVDDAVAFAGGFDLTKVRWDTPEHLADDPRRVTPGGDPYPPFHDVQALVDGEPARALGDLFRRRWRRAVEEDLTPPDAPSGDPWPPDIPPDGADVTTAVSRTEPMYRLRPEVREIEALYVDIIGRARRTLYIENQYFTSSRIARAIIERLEEEDGPEVVIVLPHSSSGWLEETTMDTGRAAVVSRLRASDRFGRLGVYYPALPDVEPGNYTLHAKVMISDDEIVRIGSSNLNNRSLGLDTECDLAFEAAGEERPQSAFETFRTRLVSEHLGVSAERLREAVAAKDSLLLAIEDLRGAERTLIPLEVSAPEWLGALGPYANPADPERPVDPETMIERFVANELQETGKAGVFHFAVILAALTALTIGWTGGTVADWTGADALRNGYSITRFGILPIFVVPVLYVVGGLARIPVTLLVGVTAIVLDLTAALFYAFLGCVFSAAVGYHLGRYLGRELLRRLAGRHLNRLSALLGAGDQGTIAKIRLIPTIPFALANLVMGAAGIDFRTFAAGTTAGLAPCVIAMCLFTEHLKDLLRSGSPADIVVLVVTAAFILIASLLARRSLLKRHDSKAPSVHSTTQRPA